MNNKNYLVVFKRDEESVNLKLEAETYLTWMSSLFPFPELEGFFYGKYFKVLEQAYDNEHMEVIAY